jgi:hypothetical protein
MLDLPVVTILKTAELTHPKTKSTREPKMLPCSQLVGRERWYVDVLEDNPRLAAAVELVLLSEMGIQEAGANPLTGRVLVRYNPDLLLESVEALIRRAIDLGPMSPEDFAAVKVERRHSFSANHLIAAEIGCTAAKMFFLGGFCPLAVIATVGLFLFNYQRSLA